MACEGAIPNTIQPLHRRIIHLLLSSVSKTHLWEWPEDTRYVYGASRQNLNISCQSYDDEWIVNPVSRVHSIINAMECHWFLLEWIHLIGDGHYS